MSYIDRLDKDELRYTVEEQERYKKEALQILKGIELGEWDHKACGCSYGCGDGHDDNIKECDCQDEGGRRGATQQQVRNDHFI